MTGRKSTRRESAVACLRAARVRLNLVVVLGPGSWSCSIEIEINDRSPSYPGTPDWFGVDIKHTRTRYRPDLVEPGRETYRIEPFPKDVVVVPSSIVSSRAGRPLTDRCCSL